MAVHSGKENIHPDPTQSEKNKEIITSIDYIRMLMNLWFIHDKQDE